jgi:predicted nucleotidyltransferase
MHFENYFGIKKINQIIFNNKINWFFDIKSVIYKRYHIDKIKRFALEIKKNNKLLKKNRKKKKTKKIFLKKINLKKLEETDGGIKIIGIIKLIESTKLLDYFDHFIFQGSIASYDFVKNWSDIDILVVIKDEVLNDEEKLIELRKKLKTIYKQIIKFSKLQHHGFIFYTNLDLNNYLSGYLPPEALKFNFSLIKKNFIEFKISNQKKINLSKSILIEKKNFYRKTLKDNSYNHHVIRKKIPKVPFKSNDPYMFQLFYNFGSILNIPILYLDACGKSSHKKDSFKKFYKIIKNEFVIDFIKKHEEIRKNWIKYKFKDFNIPNSLIKKIGNNYFYDCYKVYKIVCEKFS